MALPVGDVVGVLRLARLTTQDVGCYNAHHGCEKPAALVWLFSPFGDDERSPQEWPVCWGCSHVGEYADADGNMAVAEMTYYVVPDDPA